LLLLLLLLLSLATFLYCFVGLLAELSYSPVFLELFVQFLGCKLGLGLAPRHMQLQIVNNDFPIAILALSFS
jgi:hypothetical protein